MIGRRIGSVLVGAILAAVLGTPAASSAQMLSSPVERAEPGLWGLEWQFGGLATLTATGNSDKVNELTISQVAIKYVPSEQWRILGFFGTGLMVTDPSHASTTTDWGIHLGGGAEYHFRIWQRISPFVGAQLRISSLDPTGPNNWMVGFGFGPQAGIEYFIANRLSLQATYSFLVNFNFEHDLFVFSFQTQSGGTLGITAYF